MAEGIRINDAALEITPAGLDALVKGQGASVTLTNLDLTVSPEALNTLLGALATDKDPAPSAALGEGRLQVTAQRGEQRLALDLRAGSLRLRITAEGLRLSSE